MTDYTHPLTCPTRHGASVTMCTCRSAAEEKPATPRYEWHIEVRRLNHYGDRVTACTPVVVVAATKAEVTTKVRAMFNATYDDFRGFWSHTWALNTVREVTGS